jgi:hypothetical protein
MAKSLRPDELRTQLLIAESSLEKWTREAKPSPGRITHLRTSRAFNLAYWQGYRDAVLRLQQICP